MASPSYRGAGAIDTSVTSGQNLDPVLPTGWASGDIHIVVVTWVGTVTPNTPTDYTEWTDLQYRNGSTFNANVYWKRAAGGDADPVLIGMSSATTNLRSARVYGYSGALSAGDPADDKSVNGNAAGTTVATAQIDTTVTDTIVAFLYAYEDDPTAATQPSGYSAFDISTSSTASDTAHGGSWKQLSVAGSENPSTTVSGGTFANSVSVAFLIALKSDTSSAGGAGAFGRPNFYRRRMHQHSR